MGSGYELKSWLMAPWIQRPPDPPFHFSHIHSHHTSTHFTYNNYSTTTITLQINLQPPLIYQPRIFHLSTVTILSTPSITSSPIRIRLHTEHRPRCLESLTNINTKCRHFPDHHFPPPLIPQPPPLIPQPPPH